MEMKRARAAMVALLSVGIIGAVGCGPTAEVGVSPVAESPSGAPNAAQSKNHGKKKVLTSFTVLADMAREVAGEALVVESIARVGAEIHGYEPTPSDLVRAQDADLILYNGLNLEVWFEGFLGSVGDVPAAVLTEGIEPLPIAEGPYADRPNPHAWMSPQNAVIYVENIRRAFVALDPDNAATYNANAAAYTQKLAAIDGGLRADLARVPAEQRYLVSCEGAFAYLAQDYGLEEIYLWPINAEQQLTPKQVRTVIEKVRARNIPAVFCESTVSDNGQREVARATGARFGGNLYVDSLSPADGPVPTFLDLLEYDIQIITDGLLAGS